MKPLLFLLLLLPFLAPAQDCPPERFRLMLRQVDTAVLLGQYDLAINKLQSAKTCQPDSEAVVNRRVLEVFRAVNAERTRAIKNEKEAKRQEKVAEAEARRIYANDMAFKSQIALKDGDRNTAFRLGEFAQRYVDGENEKVVQALVDALYYNDDPDSTHRLPRVMNLEGHTDRVNSVDFSPDGQHLATTSEDNTVIIWNVGSGKTERTFKDPNVFCGNVTFSPNGKDLAIWSSDSIVKIWDWATGKVEQMLESHASSVCNVAFSSDGKHLATGAKDYSAIIWNLTNGKVERTLEGQSSDVTTMAFSPDGKYIATGYRHDMLKIWNLTSGQAERTLAGYAFGVQSVAFSPNGKQLAIGTLEGVQVYNLDSAKIEHALESGTFMVYSVAFSPDGQYIALGTSDNTAEVWDLGSGKTLKTFKGHTDLVYSVAFSPDGQCLATGSLDKTVKIWNLESNSSARSFEGHKDIIAGLAFSSDGKYLATGARDKTAKIWDLSSSKIVRTLEGHTDMIWSVAFSPDGKRLATGAQDHTAKIWNLDSGKVERAFEGYAAGVKSVAFSPACPNDPRGGKFLATGSGDWALFKINGTVKLWNLDSEKTALTLEDHTDVVYSVSFSPDGKRLATACRDHTARAWNLDSGKAERTFEGHTDRVFCVAFSPDGKHLATGSDDQSAKIWDLNSGKAILSLESHYSGTLALASVFSVAFSKDGKRLAVGASDKTAKIWNLDSGQAVLTLGAHPSGVNNLAFTPDGKHLATACANTVKIWEITADSLILRWQETGPQASLTLPQLQQYNLESLLDQRPDNEQKLISTRETWQIKAFADLAAAQAAGSNIPAKVEPAFARADRLYAAALALQDERLIRQDYAAMLRRWAEVYRADGQERKAAELEAKANTVTPAGE